MTHPSPALTPWRQLTSGRPDALRTPGRSRGLAARLAVLTGCQKAILGSSTLHLFWDLFNTFANEPVAVFIDRSAYPISRWGTVDIRSRGMAVVSFSHHDPEALRERIASKKTPWRRPVVVTDGFCPSCGKAAPLMDYLDIVRQNDGWLVIDDTQSLGIWGHQPDRLNPYGSGGGGSLRLQGMVDPRIILVSSLAKGFGAPLAMLAGSSQFVQRFKARSKTRMHCSPPSMASLAAVEHALAVNAARGDGLRLRLARLVDRFKAELDRRGVSVPGGRFPVKTIPGETFANPARLHHRLHTLGLRAVLHHHCRDRRPRISFLITTGHRGADILNACVLLTTAATEAGRLGNKRRWHQVL
jgi:8-amino-7-oxononanoate synthase